MFNPSEYKVLKATREVKHALYQFEKALRCSDTAYQEASRTLAEMESVLGGYTVHLDVVIRNVINMKQLEYHMYGIKKKVSQKEVLSWLSVADLDVYEKARLQTMKIVAAKTNLQCLANICSSLQHSYQKAENILMALDLRSIVVDVGNILEEVKLNGLGELTDRLNSDIDKLLCQSVDIDQLLDNGEVDVEGAVKPLRDGVRDPVSGDNFLHSILVQSGLAVDLDVGKKYESLVS